MQYNASGLGGGWWDVGLDGWTDGWVDEWMHRKRISMVLYSADGQYLDSWVDGWKDGWKEGWVDRWM